MNGSNAKEYRTPHPQTPYPARRRVVTSRERRLGSKLTPDSRRVRERESQPQLKPDHQSVPNSSYPSEGRRHRSISPVRPRRQAGYDNSARHYNPSQSQVASSREVQELRRELHHLAQEKRRNMNGANRDRGHLQESTASMGQPGEVRSFSKALQGRMKAMEEKLRRMEQSNPTEAQGTNKSLVSLFTKEVMTVPLPKGFKMPQMDPYDRLTDPRDHLGVFNAKMLLNPVRNAILCRAFPTTLKKAARAWYSGLQSRSIGSFKQLSQQIL